MRCSIGNREGRDGGDGSHQTLSIRRTLDGSYSVLFIDEGASACNGESGSARFTGKPNQNYLSAIMQFECDLDTGKMLGLTPIGLTYNPLNDTLIDSWRDKWTRR